MNANNFTPEEQELIRLYDEDTRKMITHYIKGELYSHEFIRSLNLEQSKDECRDYNNHVKEFNYYKGRINQFTDYMNYMDKLLQKENK